MAYVDIVTALAVLQFIVFGFKVGGARGRYGVKAPAITGNEIFERHFRVQQNTLEQLIAFLPGLYLFSHYFSPLVAAALGVVYLIGREVYAATYVKDPAKRERRLWHDLPAHRHSGRGRSDRRGSRSSSCTEASSCIDRPCWPIVAFRTLGWPWQA